MYFSSVSIMVQYITELQKHGVHHVVRLCFEETYKSSAFDNTGIVLHAWPFPDGDPPPPAIIDDWMKLVDSTMNPNKDLPSNDNKRNSIALHCVAGLGRSPVMAAIALIEHGLDWQYAVDLIRSKR